MPVDARKQRGQLAGEYVTPPQLLEARQVAVASSNVAIWPVPFTIPLRNRFAMGLERLASGAPPPVTFP